VPVEEPEAEEVNNEPEENATPVIVRPQNTHTIEIEGFVSAEQVDARYHEKPYYIVPREPVARRCVRRRGRAGRVMLSLRERPILIARLGNGLCGVTLRFADRASPDARHPRLWERRRPDERMPGTSGLVS
jgi:non-homologous end joining protein Ku